MTALVIARHRITLTCRENVRTRFIARFAAGIRQHAGRILRIFRQMRHNQHAIFRHIRRISPQTALHVAFIADVHRVEAPELTIRAFRNRAVTAAAHCAPHGIIPIGVNDLLILIHPVVCVQQVIRLVGVYTEGIGIILRAAGRKRPVIHAIVLEHHRAFRKTGRVVLMMLPEVFPRHRRIVRDNRHGCTQQFRGIIGIQLRDAQLLRAHAPAEIHAVRIMVNEQVHVIVRGNDDRFSIIRCIRRVRRAVGVVLLVVQRIIAERHAAVSKVTQVRPRAGRRFRRIDV